MATLQSLIDIWRIKAGGYRDALPGQEADQIKLLNAAKEKVWQHIVAAGRANGGNGNWFIKSATVAVSTGERDKDLATDFHDMLMVESLTSGWEGVKFEGTDFYKTAWRDSRRTAGNADATVTPRFYVVAGDYQAKILLDRAPNANIVLTYWYTSILPEWTADTDVIDRILRPYQDAIVNLAAMMNAMSRHDAAIAGLWKSLWDEDKALILGTANTRQGGNVVEPKPYDNTG